MTEYQNFSVDFISRTKEIMDGYAGEYEVTNLINCCLGLIVIPKQKFGDAIPTDKSSKDIEDLGISKSSIQLIDKCNYSVSNVVRHIRNGIAHGRIKQKTDKGVITGLRIHDKKTEKDPENFVIELSIHEFKEFAIKFSELFA